MLKFFRLSLLLLTIGALTACADDDDYAADYVYDFAEISVDAAGKVRSFVRDNGEIFSVSNDFGTEFADTALRAFVFYVLQSDAAAELRQISRVLTTEPIELADTAMRIDPVDVVAVWRGNRYLNLTLGLKTGGSTAHYLGMRRLGTETNASGGQTLRLQLYHDQNGDATYYTRTSYVSCRLDCEPIPLTSGDSVRIEAQTFDGVYSKTLPF